MLKFQTSLQRMYGKKMPVDTLKKRSNESLTDTKGFIPLKVQIKRYLLAGVRLQTMREQYTCEDYLEAYKDIPCITEDMDITEITQAVQHVNMVLEQRRLERVAAESPDSALLGSAEAQKNAAADPETVSESVDSVAGNDVELSGKE